MANAYVSKWGWGSTGPVKQMLGTPQATQLIESPAGGISRIRNISVFGNAGANGASSGPIFQIPLIVLRGGPTLGANNAQVIDLLSTFNSFGIPTVANCPYEILFAKNFQVLHGDTEESFSEGELVAFDGDRFAIISFSPFDASGTATLPVSQCVFGHSTLGEDLSADVIQSSYIAGHYGNMKSLPRYHVSV